MYRIETFEISQYLKNLAQLSDITSLKALNDDFLEDLYNNKNLQ